MSFTPPPNDPHRITRAQLAADLEATLVATPLFAPHLLPLLLEKLGATLRCVGGWGWGWVLVGAWWWGGGGWVVSVLVGWVAMDATAGEV